MTEPTPHQQSVIWGHAYEILVKRGCLAYLIEQGLVSRERETLTPWLDLKLSAVEKSVIRQLEVIDPDARSIVSSAVRHLALTAFGTGYTAIRAYVKSIEGQLKSFSIAKLQVRGLWCPLMLPGDKTSPDERRTAARHGFAKEFGLGGFVDPAWSGTGQPANADFTLWMRYAGKSDYLLVEEYSFDMRGAPKDFRDQEAHLKELSDYRRVVDSRSVFARVAAQVEGEQFLLSEDLRLYLPALTSKNKPFFKLCQASSYAATTAALLEARGLVIKPMSSRALAITPNGLESLAARFDDDGNDPRAALMGHMAAAYCDAQKIPDGDEDALRRLAEQAFKGTLNKLPLKLRQGMKRLQTELPKPGEDYRFEFEEKTSDFANPMQAFSASEALGMITGSQALENYFGGSAKANILAAMRAIGDVESMTLRDIHAAAVVAGMEQAKAGSLSMIALEGNPGIGKTTAVRKHLSKKTDGYLFLYLSPRVIINRSVTTDLARDRGKASGILTLTTNAQLIAAADRWHKKNFPEEASRKVEGALVADGVDGLITPQGSILVLTPVDEQAIENEHAGTGIKKTSLSEHEDQVTDKTLPGVLATMSRTAHELLELNPSVNRLVMTAALQGFRERANQKTTIEALSRLFMNRADSLAGVDERRKFARRIPNVVVMVDELAGDGAGAPFVHAISRWLRQEFLDSFEEEVSPFTLTLIASDASLGNEVVLDRYLNAGERTPDKILVSRSRGKKPFDVTVTDVRIGGRTVPTLHVMTNSFPASELTLKYRINMSSVDVGVTQAGEQMSVRQAIQEAAEERLLSNACSEITQALRSGARQVIYFAQNKLFLRAVQDALTSDGGASLKDDDVAVLDSSVPAYQRKRLIEESVRDKVRVFLMTSSGARGVSFPLTDWIIAAVPRFNVESALMEIAQLIYRGRGKRTNEAGKEVSEDHARRTLVMTVDDFLVSDGTEDEVDPRQWLRQSLDLMTLLVMLRSTIFTRITGEADLVQPIALVPVGAVGVEEMVSLMSQYVSAFVREASLYQYKSKSRELSDLAMRARDNVIAIFRRTHLRGVAQRGVDGRTFVREADVKAIIDIASNPLGQLLPDVSTDRSLIPDHMSFSGPVVVENWSHFEKQEVFSFEEHDLALTDSVRKLKGQLHAIDEERRFPSSIRVPAASLLKLLYRESHEAANEFKTLKALKSPNTWIAVPAGYYSFINSPLREDDRKFALSDEADWHEALTRSLNGSGAVMPPLPFYETFPWAATVGQVSPLKLDLVFDDRYFMASNELNLLNTLLLAKQDERMEGASS